ncbi:MAG: recombination regulator RecX [Brevinematales bacterium]|nr:recombination regulator RecX [Brevinematales bacterium]
MPERKSIAKKVALRYLKYRPRSREEVKRRLIRQGFEEEVIVDTLVELEKEGWFDDFRLAKEWAEERLRTRGLSLASIHRELRRKGILEEVIEQALSEVVYNEKEVVWALLHKKDKGEKDEAYLVSLLVRRGYPYEKARDYVRVWRTKEES